MSSRIQSLQHTLQCYAFIILTDTVELFTLARKEIIPGAFTGNLNSNDDIMTLINHVALMSITLKAWIAHYWYQESRL